MIGHISQRPWTPTKRRGPIAAEFSGPGPAWVTLPSLIGKASAPSSSLHYRHPEPKPFITPAPGSYCPEKADESVQPSAAKFSFGHRTNIDIKNNTPAPNVYNVPPVLGNCPEGTKKKAPAYSISGRGKEQVDFRAANPGPGKYESGNMNMVRSKAPSYSLSIRTQLPSDDTKKPGPGAHSPEKVNMSPGPALTFGIKHSPYTAPMKNGGW